MSAVTKAKALPARGAELGGGFFAGLVMFDDTEHLVIVGGKAMEKEAPWGEYGKLIKGADSFVDGLANTDAMAKAGSKLAKDIRALTTGGFKDWHIPAADVLEVIYRAFKPTTDKNYCYGRDGYNGHSVPMHLTKYTPKDPLQTAAKAFKKGGAQAFEDRWYWSSTQYSSHYAFGQHFVGGFQNGGGKDVSYLVRPVRLIPR
jgi:hypothetical protein